MYAFSLTRLVSKWWRMQQHFFGWPLAVAGSWFIAPANAIFVRTSAVERNHNFQNFANSSSAKSTRLCWDFSAINIACVSTCALRCWVGCAPSCVFWSKARCIPEIQCIEKLSNKRRALARVEKTMAERNHTGKNSFVSIVIDTISPNSTVLHCSEVEYFDELLINTKKLRQINLANLRDFSNVWQQCYFYIMTRFLIRSKVGTCW